MLKMKPNLVIEKILFIRFGQNPMWISIGFGWKHKKSKI